MDMECLEHKKKIWEETRDWYFILNGWLIWNGYRMDRIQEMDGWYGMEIRWTGYKRWMVDWNGYRMDRIQEMDGWYRMDIGWTGYKRWVIDMEWI